MAHQTNKNGSCDDSVMSQETSNTGTTSNRMESTVAQNNQFAYTIKKHPYLTRTTAIGIIIVILLIMTTIILYKLTSGPSVCKRAECLKQLNFLKLRLSKTLDPCDNFFDYTCNTWNVHHPTTSYRMFIQELYNERITHFYSKQLSPKYENSIVSSAAYLYQKCAFTKESNRDIAKSIQEMINLHNMQINKSLKQPIVDTLIYLGNKYDFNFIFTVRPRPDSIYIYGTPKDPALQILDIDASTAPLEFVLPRYSSVLEALGVFNAQDIARQIALIEAQFVSKLAMNPACALDVPSQRVREMNGLHSNITQADDNEQNQLYNAAVSLVIIRNGSLLKVSECAAHSVRTLNQLGESNATLYIQWLAHKYFGLPLFANAFFQGYDRQLKCIYFTDRYLGAALIAPYIWENISQKHLLNMKDATKAIVDAVKKRFESSWLSSKEKRTFIEKLTQINIGVPLPNYMNNLSILDKHYANYTRNTSRYAEFLLQISETYMREVRRLGQNENNKHETFAILLSQYADRNIVIAPMTAVPPIYFADGVMALNMGEYFEELMHEIMHAFVAIEYRLPPPISLENRSQTFYYNRAMCYIDVVSPELSRKLSKFVLIDEYRGLESQQIAERLADFMGFDILLDLVNDKYSEETLEGFTPLQLTLIGRCAKYCDHGAGDILYPSFHDRCNRLLRANQAFRQAFKCSRHSYMGSIEPCTPFFNK